jgi:hypothetical protein
VKKEIKPTSIGSHQFSQFLQFQFIGKIQHKPSRETNKKVNEAKNINVIVDLESVKILSNCTNSFTKEVNIFSSIIANNSVGNISYALSNRLVMSFKFLGVDREDSKAGSTILFPDFFMFFKVGSRSVPLKGSGTEQL